MGALAVAAGVELAAQQTGGGQERGRRAGTENVPGIIGLGKAAQLATEALERGDLTQMSAMRDHIDESFALIRSYRKDLGPNRRIGPNGAAAKPTRKRASRA